MDNIIRRSPVSFDAQPTKTEMRDNWSVTLEYGAEETGPYVIDLSHRSRWDLQDTEIAKVQPWGIHIPDAPGQCILDKGILINRMNRTQASIWHLTGEKPDDPEGPAFTEVTDVTVFLALFGKEVFSIAEKLTARFFRPAERDPFFTARSVFACSLPNCHPGKDSGKMRDSHDLFPGLCRVDDCGDP